MRNSAIFSCLLISISICTPSSATHFQGGTITYKVLNTTGSTVSILLTQTYIYDYTKIDCTDSMIANQSPKLTFAGSYLENNASVTCIQYCNQSGGYTPQPVVSYCTDYSAGLGITVGQRSDRIDLVNGSYFLVAFQSLSWRKLSRPSTSTNSNTYWSILSLINLRMRADGTYNHPPAGAIISPIYIPVGIQQVIAIPTIDGDNDVVRCRLASGTNECGSACPPATLPNGTVLLSNCTLLITGINVGDWYAIAIQVSVATVVKLEIEDFINSTSTTPLSTVPLQFLINVQAVSSCSIRPRLTGPKSQTGQCVAIRVGQPYVIELVAENFCSSPIVIQDIATLSFPIVVKTPIVHNTTTTLWSATLTWTPTAASVGSQVLCAVAVDSMNVQSNQYCMTFTVSDDTIPTCPGETTTTTTTTTSTTVTTTSTTTITTATTSTTTLTTATTTSTTTTTTSSTITTTSTTTTTTSTTATTTSTTTTTTSSTITTTSTTTITTSTTATTTSSTTTTTSTDTSTSSTTTSTTSSTTSTTTPVSTTTATSVTATIATQFPTSSSVLPPAPTVSPYSTYASWISATQSSVSTLIDSNTTGSTLTDSSASSTLLTTQSSSQQNTGTLLDTTTQSTTSTSLPTRSTDSSTMALQITTNSVGSSANTLLSQVSIGSSNMSHGQSPNTTLKSHTTDAITESSLPKPVFPWLEVAVLLAVLALILLALALCCCCCLYCFPQCCPCCPLKRQRKTHSPSRQPAQTNGLGKLPIAYYLIDNSFAKNHHHDADVESTSRSLSATSSRTADDIQLHGLSSARSEKRIPHYATPLHRSSRVAPAPSLSISISSIPSASSANYVFGSRQTSSITQRSAK